MLVMKVETDFAEVAKRLAQLPTAVRGPVAVSTVNKTVAKAQTQMKRQITGAYNLSSSFVSERLSVTKATLKGGSFTMQAELVGGKGRGRSANLIAFAERFTSFAAGRKRAKEGTQDQVHVKIKRGGKAKPLGKRAFIANKGRTVFEREGKARLPIKPMLTIGVPSMFNARKVNDPVVAGIRDDLPRIFESDVRFYMEKLGK